MKRLLLALLLAGCTPAARVPVRSTLPATLKGISGLAVTSDGKLWSVTERRPALVPLRLEGARVVPDGEPVTIEGWPADTDAESIAELGPGRFAVGTEPIDPSTAGRTEDRILEVTLEGGRATVGKSWTVSYEPLGMTAPANKGIEGLCTSGNRLIAVAEPVLESGEGRFAPLWVIDLATGDTRTAQVRLTSAHGKLASLDCHGDELRLIERHYDVLYLLGASLGTGDAPIRARVVRDLAVDLPERPNLEALAWLSDGRIVLVADNSGSRTVPVAALVLPAPKD
jgi:hypothetical protein